MGQEEFMNFIPLSVPSFQGREKELVNKAIISEWVSSGGSFVSLFEKNIAKYVGIKRAIATSSGTAALHIALLESGVGRGDEVIVPTVTFIAPINTVRYVGAEPIFMDCDEYLNIDVKKIEEFIEKKCNFNGKYLKNRNTGKVIKAIIPVHVFGHPVNMEHLMELAKKYNLIVIEDATESLGSRWIEGKFRNSKAGTIGDIGCFSFNGNKLITTGGGGMIVCNDGKKAGHMKYLTTQAKDDEVKYIHNEIGYNYRMSNLQAALGVAQLENIEKYIEIKRKNFKIYFNSLNGYKGLSFIEEPKYSRSNYWFYSLIVDKEKFGLSNIELMNKLAENKIQSRPLWFLNHLQKPFKSYLSYKIERAYNYYEKVLNIPCSVNLSEEEIDLVVRVIKKMSR